MTRTAVYPGTFDPIHLGHVDIATRAATIFDQLVIAVYDRPAKSLLFSVERRVELARDALALLPNVRVAPYGGLTVEFARQVKAQVVVRGLRVIFDFDMECQMAHTNYLLAPEIEYVCLMARRDHAVLSSTMVKEVALLGGDVDSMVPPKIAAALEAKRREREKDHPPAGCFLSRD